MAQGSSCRSLACAFTFVGDLTVPHSSSSRSPPACAGLLFIVCTCKVCLDVGRTSTPDSWPCGCSRRPRQVATCDTEVAPSARVGVFYRLASVLDTDADTGDRASFRAWAGPGGEHTSHMQRSVCLSHGGVGPRWDLVPCPACDNAVICAHRSQRCGVQFESAHATRRRSESACQAHS